MSYFCKNTKKEYAVLAPTGVAALNVKGQTIHRFFNFYVDITPTKIQKGEVKPKEDNEKLYKYNVSELVSDLVKNRKKTFAWGFFNSSLGLESFCITQYK